MTALIFVHPQAMWSLEQEPAQTPHLPVFAEDCALGVVCVQGCLDLVFVGFAVAA
jgi:hypothetical protein